MRANEPEPCASGILAPWLWPAPFATSCTPSPTALPTYILTSDGIRVAVFYTKLKHRLLRPLLDADKPPTQTETRRALAALEHTVNDYIHHARLAPA